MARWCHLRPSDPAKFTAGQQLGGFYNHGAEADMTQELVDQAMNEYRLAHMLMEGKVGDAVAEAIPHLRIAADCWAQALRSKQQADVLVELGKLHQRCNDAAAAVTAYEEAMRLYGALGERQSVAHAGMLAGTAIKAQGRLDLALEYLERALAINRDGGDLRHAARTQQVIASTLIDAGRGTEALVRLDEAMAVYVRFSQRTEIAQARELLAAAHHQAGDPARADECFEAAVVDRQNVGDMRGATRILSRWADLQRHGGEYDTAMRLYKRALAIHQMRGDQAMIAQVLGNMGTVHGLKGEHDEAISHYQRCRELSETAGERPAVAQALFNIACIHLNRGDEGLAFSGLNQALGLCDELGYRSLAERILAALREIYLNRHEPELARACLQRRVDLLDAMAGDPARLLEALDELSAACREDEDWDNAAEYQRRALATGRERIAPIDLAFRRHQLGAVHGKRADYPAAVENYQHALTLYSDLKQDDQLARTLRSLANAELQIGASADALAHFQRCLELAEPSGDPGLTTAALVGMGNAHVQLGAAGEAKSAFARAAALSEAHGDERGTQLLRKATNSL